MALDLITQNTSGDPDQVFEVAKLLSDRCDFLLAIPKFLEAADGFLQLNKIDEYFECQNYLLKCYAERDDQERIKLLKDNLQDFILKHSVEMTSKTLYSLALCASYRGQHDTALEYLQKSLSLALAQDDKKAICFAINGIAICYKNQGKYTEALKEIYNLQIFFQVIDLPEVQMACLHLNAQIFNDLQKHEQALEIFWKTFEMLNSNKFFSFYLRNLYFLGKTYLLLGEKENARIYFRLAQKSIDPQNMVFLSRFVSEALKNLGEESPNQAYDLVFEQDKHSVIEKKLGKVDFKNQFILMDLLRLFVSHQGQVFSKEYLVEHVWRQNYDPSVHDNKIYVTIKRLRKMIEPDYDKPKYIFRAKNGYFMNKSARVLFEGKGEQ